MEATWWTKPEQLDDAQKKVLALDKDADHLVCGPPGSGKTNLLLLRAAFLHKINRRNFVVITYGRVLREFLATGTAHYPFSSDRLKTFASWAGGLSSAAGLSVPKSKKEEDVRAALVANLQALIEADDHPVFDCLLVDEAQDYAPNELDLMRALAKKVFFVGDDRQEIYDKRGGLAHLKGVVHSIVSLSAHYRNGLRICRVADAIYEELDDEAGLEAHSLYDEAAFPSTVIDSGDLDLVEQAAKAVDEIANQLIAYPSGLIGVLCPRHVDLDVVAEVLQSSSIKDKVQVERFADGYSPLAADRRVLVTTLHGAKGLEFRAVHILAADAIGCFRKRTKKVAYTSVTRAKTYLAVYHDRSLPGFFEKSLTCAEVEPTPDPSLDELFK